MAQSTFNIEVLSVSEPSFVKTARGGYNTIEVAFKNQKSGKVEGKKLVDFNNQTVFAAVKELKTGQVVKVVSEKGENDKFWNWTSVGGSGGDSGGTSQADGVVAESTPQPSVGTESRTRGGNNRVTGSNYETPEERARRQVYIVRQSSLTAASGILGAGAELEAIIEMAEKIEKWALRGYDVYKDGGIEKDSGIPI